jgi:hypothetical protein
METGTRRGVGELRTDEEEVENLIKNSLITRLEQHSAGLIRAPITGLDVFITHDCESATCHPRDKAKSKS